MLFHINFSNLHLRLLPITEQFAEENLIQIFKQIKIVDEEADESLFWLEFIQELEIDCNKTELEKLIKEADELVSIFSAGIKTIKSRNNKK